MKRAGIWLAMVWNFVVVLCCFVLFQRCSGRVAKGGKGILECYDCEEVYNGDCALGKDLGKTLCIETALTCYSMIYYNPFNEGYGGKYNYKRGCNMFSKVEDYINFTVVGHSLLEEYIGPIVLCNTSFCNKDPMEDFKIEDPIGLKL